MKKVFFTLISLGYGCLSGCADLTHFNDVEEIEGNTAIMMDAKQRGVYYWKRPIPIDSENVEAANQVMNGFCAEPNPDAVSAMAATLGLDLTITDKGKLGLSQSISEGVANIGVRTAAIQALRDIMYRNCEAFANGGITKFGLETLQRRFQNTMVAILSIEQLTGAFRAPPVVINTSSSLGSPESIIELTNKSEIARIAYEEAKTAENSKQSELEKQKKALGDAETKLTDFEDDIKAIEGKKSKGETLTPEEETTLASKDTKITELNEVVTAEKEKVSTAEGELDSLKTATKKKKDAYDVIESSRVAATTGVGSTSATANVIPSFGENRMSEQNVDRLASAVEKIVETTTQLSYYTEVCTTLIGQNANIKPEEGSPLESCNLLLLAADDKKLRAKVFEAGFVDKIPNDNDEDDVTPNPFGEVPVTPQLSKQNIEFLQSQLDAMGLKDSQGNQLLVDGILGKSTKFAIEELKNRCDEIVRKPLPELTDKNIGAIATYMNECK